MAREVLHILGSAQHEGSSIARVVATLAQGLDPARFRLRACFLQGDGPMIQILERAGVECIVLDWSSGARDPLGALEFWRRLRALRVDLLHIHFGGRSVRKLAHSATGARILMHLHSRILEPRGLEPVQFPARGIDAVVAASHAVARCVVDGCARVIYAGTEVICRPNPHDVGRRDLTVGVAGRLVNLKGLEYLFRAAAALQEFPNLRIEVAGTGPERATLEATARNLGIEERVKFLGWVENIQSVMACWDVFVLPSLEEGFPLAALDAMAAGLPVIASSVGGVPELIVDGDTGWLVPPANVDALASRLGELLRDAGRRQTMGEAGRVRVQEQFNQALMTQGFARLYDEILSARGI